MMRGGEGPRCTEVMAMEAGNGERWRMGGEACFNIEVCFITRRCFITYGFAIMED